MLGLASQATCANIRLNNKPLLISYISGIRRAFHTQSYIALSLADTLLGVGLDGGYVRHWHKKGCFEAIAGKSIPAEGPAKCFGFVQEVDTKPRRRVFEVLRAQGLQANQAVEFFTDGAPVLRSLTSYLSAGSTHILDWFHLTMHLTVLHQYALGFVQVDAAGGKALQDGLTSIKWHLWHGNVERALEKILDLDDALATHQDNRLLAKQYGKLKPLARLIADFQTYAEQNGASIVDYSERQRYGERVPTGFVESAVNQVLAKRFVKRQQMQWTKKGAHLLVQVRTKVLNEEWKECFRQQYPASGHCRQNRYRWPPSPTAPHFLMLSGGME